jgi:transposase
MDSILALFCGVDDFWQEFAPRWHQVQIQNGSRHRRRASAMHPSEMMTILILFHQSGYRTFKDFYHYYVGVQLRSEFPTLVSYPCFVRWMPHLLVPLCAYLHTVQGQCTGLSFIDSTKLIVCRNPRIPQHRVFAGIAARGKSSTGWFYGFKLHLVINDQGELLSWCLTRGNVDDRRPVPELVRMLAGKLFGDKGYISAHLAEQLRETGVTLITKLRKNMRPHAMDPSDKLLLRRRSIIETINDQLKNISQIEHTRHRSPLNFLVNVVSGLIAYCHQPKKPSLHLAWLLLPTA